jgi:hypothetical protein
MSGPRFRTPQLQVMFETCLRLAADNFSEFYYSKPLGPDRVVYGPRWPRRGAAHRHHFWNGFLGGRASFVTGSLVHAAYRAGQEFRRQRGGPPGAVKIRGLAGVPL